MRLPGQLLTLDRSRPQATATASAPPKRRISSDPGFIPDGVSHCGIFVNPNMRYTQKSQKGTTQVTGKRALATILKMPARAKNYPHQEAGGRLKVARLALGFESAKDFANYINVNAQTYRNWERGERQLDYETMHLLADIGVNLNYVVSGIAPAILPVERARTA